MALRKRAHLLTEENQVLFEQMNQLRAHYDQFNKEHADKVDEANKKIARYAKLENEL